MQEDISSGKGGAKNGLNKLQNIGLRQALNEYYDILDENNAIQTPAGSRLPKACLRYSKNKRRELLRSIAFADLSDELLSKAEQVFFSLLFTL